MRIDCHLHTPLCGHAYGNPVEFIPLAVERGIQLLTFTCHIPMDSDIFGGPRIRMAESQFEEYQALVGEAAQLGQEHEVEVLLGIEAEIFPEPEPMEAMDRFLAKHPLDFVLGSLHHQLPSYRLWLEEHGVDSDEAIVDTYFKHLADGVRTGRYHSIAHPDVIRIYGTVDHMEPSGHEQSFKAFLQAVIEQDICIEVNTSGLSKGVYEVHPDPLFLQWAFEMGVKLTLGSDSHLPDSVGQHFDPVLTMLKEIGFQHVHYHKAGGRIAVAID